MIEPPIPANEKERIESLHALGILDTPPEERFDRITQTAKEIFDVPIALVSIIDVNRQWFKSCIGLNVSETPRGVSFCGYAILQNEPFIIPDSRKDERFADNPLVTGAPHVIFYAGIPIAAIDGNNVGTLCIIDTKPREFSPTQIQMLRNLGAWAQLEINSRNLASVTAEQRKISKEIEAFFDSSYDLMWIGNVDGKFEKVNPTFTRILGYTADELSSDKFIEATHEDNKHSITEMFESLRKGAAINNLIIRFLSKSGVYIWLQWNVVAQGGKVYATARNITKEKEAQTQSGIQQERLEHLTSKFAFATASAKLGIWEWDVIENRLVWDDQMYVLYGIKKENFGGAYGAWQKGLHPDDRKEGDLAIQQALSGEKDFDTSFHVVWPDGSIHTIKAYAAVERNEKGVPQRMIGVNFDITKSATIDKEKTEFVSLASHQLKTPIGAIQWNMEMVLAGDYGAITDKQKEVLQETYTMSTRMNDLVNALLNISRIEMGVFIIEPKPIDFVKLCDEVIVEMEGRRVKKGHELTKDFDANLPQVPADEKLLRIVFQNFISNAIKYTPDKGNVKVSLKSDGSTITFSVANNGEPIPEAEQVKIFGKMFRASNAQEQDPDGNGLGLYVVKQIVENAGGKVWFTSKEGEDTVFACSFPLTGMLAKAGTKALA